MAATCVRWRKACEVTSNCANLSAEERGAEVMSERERVELRKSEVMLRSAMKRAALLEEMMVEIHHKRTERRREQVEAAAEICGR